MNGALHPAFPNL